MIKAKLQAHQERALQKAKKARSGIVLSHGLGSGKTITSIAIAEDRGGPVLVILPASLESNFREEVKEFVSKDRQNAYNFVSYSKFRKKRTVDEYLESQAKEKTRLKEEFLDTIRGDD